MESYSISEGELKLNGLTLKVHTLKDGRRIIEENSLIQFMEYMQKGLLTEEDANDVAKFIKQK